MSRTILYLNNTDPQDGGGGDRRMFAEARTLAERGWDVEIIAGRTDPEQPVRRTVEDVQIRTVRSVPTVASGFPTLYFYLARSLFPLASLPILLWTLWRSEADVVVDNHTPHPSLAPLIGLVSSTPVLALVHEYHDRTALEKYPVPVGVVQLLVQNLLRLGVYGAVIVPRAQTREELVSYGVTDPVHVVPNGIDFDGYRNPPRSVSVPPFDLLVVSRLVHRKGIDLLLHAMATVVEERPETTLGVAGTGPRRQALGRLSRDLEIEDNVEFLGYVSEAEKIGHLHEAAAFVLPSRQEGFGIAVLEALATGLPVVANDLDILRALVPGGENRFADASDPDQFARAMRDVVDLDESDRATTGEANRRRAREYSWEEIGEQAKEIYDHVSADSGRF